MKIFLVSDVHVDYPANKEWVQSISLTEFQNDALIVAGDVTHRLDLLEYFFHEMIRRFKYVFFIPGKSLTSIITNNARIELDIKM
jgi:predicted phosphodiesterase